MEKYHLSRVIQDFVFLSRKRGCIRCISLQVYNKGADKTAQICRLVCTCIAHRPRRQVLFCICTDLPEPTLLTYTKYGCR